MTILLTGATGKTGTELAKTLQAADLSILIASRSGKAPAPFKAITFDWLDPTTFENPFNADPSIDRVYIVAPSWLVDLIPIGTEPSIDRTSVGTHRLEDYILANLELWSEE